jgi:hypothetical protein
VAPTFAPIVSPTVSAITPVTPTATVTPDPIPLDLSLAVQVEPPFLNPGALMTVTVIVSNPARIPVDDLIISATLPADIGYDMPLGPVTPGYNPLLRLLTWQIPQLAAQEQLSLGYVGRVAGTARAGALILVTEINRSDLQPCAAG